MQSVKINGHEFKAGDRCILTEHPGSFSVIQPPATMRAHRIVKICGGESRQWVKLDDGREFGLDGYERGKKWGERGPRLVPYEDGAMERNAAEHRLYRERRALSGKADLAHWEHIILQDDLAEKLREVLDAAEQRGLLKS